MKTLNIEVCSIASNGGVRYEARANPEAISKETFLPAKFPRLTGIKGEGETHQAAVADLMAKLEAAAGTPLFVAAPEKPKDSPYFDYENQAWVVEGRYARCGHPQNMDCRCYGKIHEGEVA